MRRFILDTGIAGLYLDRKRGVFERAEAENAHGNRIGIAAPVLAELAFRAEGSPPRAEFAPLEAGVGRLEIVAGGREIGIRVRADCIRIEKVGSPDWPKRHLDCRHRLGLGQFHRRFIGRRHVRHSRPDRRKLGGP